jgi:DNA-binding winged helix-turn-helix (wHTH) protein/tetratricopeptide (TPR) repeat protein
VLLVDGESYEFGPYRLDARKRVLWRGGELVRLPPKAVDILLALLEQHGDLVSKDELLRRVWPDTFVEEANLSVNVSALRKALGEQADGQPWIETVPRRGYRFAARPLSTPRRPLPAVAVLPFRVLGPDPVEDYLAVGMADALISRLARIGSVLVRPTRSVLRFAGAADLQEAGRELQVEAVIDGTLQRQGERLRLSLHLVPLSTRFPPWAGTFEERMTEAFAVQDAAAGAAARALAVALGVAQEAPSAPAAPHPPGPRRPRDSEAYHAYLRGRYFWSRLSGAWLEKALASFQEAVGRDPSYAPPHAGLADAYLVLGLSGVVPPRDAWPLARAAAERALELDERAPEAHVSLAAVSLFERWDWEAADRALARAEGLDPNSTGVHVWRALSLDMRSRLGEAAHARARAAELDPLSAIVNGLHAFEACLGGDHEAELERHRRTVDLDPTHFLAPWGMGLALQHLGRHRDAVAFHERAVELSGESDLMRAVLARTLALAGRRDEAAAIAAELDGLPYFSPYQRSTISLALGDRARALSDLERAAEDQDPWLVWLAADPMLAGLHGDPRVEAVRRRVFGR